MEKRKTSRKQNRKPRRDIVVPDGFWCKVEADGKRDPENQNDKNFTTLMKLVTEFKMNNPGIGIAELLESNFMGVMEKAESIGLIEPSDPIDIGLYVLGGETLEAGCRLFLRRAYYGLGAEYAGLVKRITGESVLFAYLLVKGCDGDGTHFTGRENHIWVKDREFAGKLKEAAIEVGEKIVFSGKVYRYTKRNGLTNYSVRNIGEFEKIPDYEIPSEEELLRQEISTMVCSNLCMYREHCDGLFCLAPDGWKEDMRGQVYEAATSFVVSE